MKFAESMKCLRRKQLFKLDGVHQLDALASRGRASGAPLFYRQSCWGRPHSGTWGRPRRRPVLPKEATLHAGAGARRSADGWEEQRPQDRRKATVLPLLPSLTCDLCSPALLP